MPYRQPEYPPNSPSIQLYHDEILPLTPPPQRDPTKKILFEGRRVISRRITSNKQRLNIIHSMLIIHGINNPRHLIQLLGTNIRTPRKPKIYLPTSAANPQKRFLPMYVSPCTYPA